MQTIDIDRYRVAEETDTDNQIGIEPEIEEEVKLTDPFDPEEISIDTKPVPMETLLRRLSQKTIRLNPDFQRNEVWDLQRRSQLIESLMLKIPLPMFYVAADEKSNWTVVDGLQRISTFRDFILGDEYMKTGDVKFKYHGFRLTGLEFWKDYEGCRMCELPTHLFNRILEAEFSFTVINPGTHEEVKRNIFKRINTGGLRLSFQEIRNALYTGNATRLLKELAGSEEFKEATCNSIRPLRMEDQELVLRFVAFLVRPYDTYRRTQAIDTWLSDTMIILNSLPTLETKEFNKLSVERGLSREDIRVRDFDEISRRFMIAMKRATRLFGQHAFRKSIGNDRRRPINKSLFETWGIILSGISDIEFERLLKNRERFMADYRNIIDNDAFRKIISNDSMKHSSVSSRFTDLSNLTHRYSR